MASPIRRANNLSGTQRYEVGATATPSYRPRKLYSRLLESGSAPSLPKLPAPFPARETEEQMIREAAQFRLGEWIGKHDAEKMRCASSAMAAEVKLRQALNFTENEDPANLPNKFRLATVWKCYDDLAVLCGLQFSGLFDTIRAELLRAVYVDGWERLQHGAMGTNAYARCMTYFDALQEQTMRMRALQKAHSHWQQEQMQSMDSLESRRQQLYEGIESVRASIQQLIVKTELESEKKVINMLHLATEYGEILSTGDNFSEKELLLDGLVTLLPELRMMVEDLRKQQTSALHQLDRETQLVSMFHSLTQPQKLQVTELQFLAITSNDEEPLAVEWPGLLASKLLRILLEEKVPSFRVVDVLSKLLNGMPQDVQLQVLDVVSSSLDLEMQCRLIERVSRTCWASQEADPPSERRRSSSSARPSASAPQNSVEERSWPRSPVLSTTLLTASPEQRFQAVIAEFGPHGSLVNERSRFVHALGASDEEVRRLRKLLHDTSEQLAAVAKEKEQAAVARTSRASLTRSASRMSIGKAPTLQTSTLDHPKLQRQRTSGVDHVRLTRQQSSGRVLGMGGGAEGYLSLDEIRELIGELYDSRIKDIMANEKTTGPDQAHKNAQYGELRCDFSRFAYEKFVRDLGLRSLAAQKHRTMIHSLAFHSKHGHPTALLMCHRLCGVGTPAPPMAPPEEIFFWKVLKSVLQHSSTSMERLLGDDRAFVTLGVCIRTANALMPDGDAGTKLLQRLKKLSFTDGSHDAENPHQKVLPASAEARISLEEVLPVFGLAWEELSMHEDQKLRSAFIEVQPPCGAITFQAFTDLVRMTLGQSIDDSKILAMFETALDISNSLLDEVSDVMLVQGFVYACHLHGVVRVKV